MTEDLMTIREMCEAFEVTPRTLRFYEAKELISPLREGQRRLFTNRDRARLKLILRGKRFGFSLEEIRQLLDLYSIEDQQQTQLREVYNAGVHHLSEMEQQRDELIETIADFKKHLEWGASVLAAAEKDEAAE
ncbi:putative transcriptional regulator LiuR of leucine degradation pathway, MerR family [Candidatus Rhodobacter oscarellae]|uniref:Putative transcriptional regulator LiuR of leucine degradation pathway, MerR family n=1 Tax=Candidatus Rhodobacter oscarellae TaxID=1675527 RepID=A0A0J9EAV2_9RHOB|nr:MerR family DNA-binding transcriptional regulator [Candidatus Rhodobacter lobularis]KMW59751.1 putative transcriptional regulator LiuR of leucine degradation pathway, MerR family [Candidatus Rhodobacter lobularis]